MSKPRILLLALDLSPEAELLADRVQTFYMDEVDNLHVLHVIRQGLHDPAFSCRNVHVAPHVQRQQDHVGKQVRDLLLRHGLHVPNERIHLIHGEPAYEIKRMAAELGVDLVIVGSHTKASDWLQLPGATTNCVIQGIGSDVMAVKV